MTPEQLLATALDHQRAGRFDDAETLYHQILAQQPDHFDAAHRLALLAHQRGDTDAALRLIEHPRALRPDDPVLLRNLAEIFRAAGRSDDAVAAARRAIELDPQHAEGHLNLAQALADAGDLAAAEEAARHAIALAPDNPDVHLARARALLTAGDFRRGLPEYEWRLTKLPQLRRPTAAPRWTGGGKIAGRSIVLRAEQGFGDVLQFVRYAGVLAERGATVILECQPELARLMTRAAGVSEVIPRGQPIPPANFHAPLLSLPLAMNTTSVATIPAKVPYITPHPQLLAAWKPLVENNRSNLNVGLAWSGRKRDAAEARRSCRLTDLAPLAAVPGISFYSLQKTRIGAEDPPPFPLIDLTARLSDFADTAALLSHLDLVISIDTAVAHLAGALGRPVWTLLSHAPDWRWLRDRTDSPWYPTMRCFRQQRGGDWPTVAAAVAAELRQFTPISR